MFEINIEQLVPKFILKDPEGYALAKAIEAGLRWFVTKAGEGIAIIQDVSAMPEWRLDEMAWELNALYDYTADIEMKRHWIADAVPLYAAYGTKAAIYNFLTGVFDRVIVQEADEYGGYPFHFRVIVDAWENDMDYAWAMKTITTTKNVRSVLDGIYASTIADVCANGTGEVTGYGVPVFPGDTTYCGTVPQ